MRIGKQSAFLGILAILTFASVLIACGDDSGDDSDTTMTYRGTFGGDIYVLSITGRTYVLSKDAYTSTGIVLQQQGTTNYLKPSVTATAFTATVTTNGLTELQGTIMWDNGYGGIPETLPGALSPIGGPDSGNGGGNGGSPVPGPSGPGGGAGEDILSSY
jgi:hypothetical protein